MSIPQKKKMECIRYGKGSMVLAEAMRNVEWVIRTVNCVMRARGCGVHSHALYHVCVLRQNVRKLIYNTINYCYSIQYI